MGNLKRIGMMATGVAFCALLAAPSFAAVVNPGDIIRFSFAPGHASGFAGGAFLAYDTTTQSSWYTFCLEYNENISLGTNYIVSSVISEAVNGGVSGGNPDRISPQTAYLYYLYATGGLDGVSGAGTAAQQVALQNVFWYLENEIASLPSNSLTDKYHAIAITADGSQSFGVLVVNPVTAAGGLAQSQLVYVPEPGALLLFGSGLAGLIAYRRRRRAE
jgi:hypothetical protein